MQTTRAAVATTFTAFSLVLALLTGCGKNASETAGGPAAAMVPAETNSFTQVTSHLDAGGNLYVYLGTAQWLDGLSDKIGGWRDTIQAIPNMKDEDRDTALHIFDLATNLIKDSGIEDVSGFGMSSFAVEKEFYRNKMILHHYPGRGTGFLWTVFGAEPHRLDGLDLLPATTAFASFGDLDLEQLWSVVEKDLSQSGIPDITENLAKVRDGFTAGTGLNLDETLASLGGEYGIAITLDDTKSVSVPTGPTPPVQFPEPGILIIAKVKNDLIFNRVDELLKTLKMPVTQNDANGLKMRTVTIPLPLPITLKPSIARSGDYLFLASSDTLIEQALAVQSGKQPGLKSTDEFKKLAQGLPERANRFAYVSKRFGESWLNLQEQFADRATGNAPAQAQLMRKLGTLSPPTMAFTVAANTPEGWMMTGNGSEDMSKIALLPVVVVPAVAAGVALPAFAKARTAAQKNACINNLRQIDGAKQQWALEHGKSGTDTPTWDDLKPYLGGRSPKCPGGGDYSINAMNEKPTCSVHGDAD